MYIPDFIRKTIDRQHRIFCILAGGMILYSCASVGTLGGGDYDEAPPVFLGGSPAPNSLNANSNRISITFDEYIKLDKPTEKIVVSPPQLQQPEINARSKRVVVNLQDTLRPNTTYTIDFSDAIQDNNEGNPLENFVYTFSTGDVLDSMSVSGTLLNASNLEPIKGALIGLHSDLADSAFKTKPFDRVGRSDSRGKFSIKGIAPGRYRIYALQDADGDYKYSQPAEAIAFYDSIVVPYSEPAIRMDTTWVDSLTIDSITPRNYTRFLPDDLLLRSFSYGKKSQRLAKSERATKKQFTLYFTAPADTLPTIEGLNFNADSAFVIDRLTSRIDTIRYWIKDSLIYKTDTLRMRVSYLYTDSTGQLTPRTDTLALVSKERVKTEAQLKKEREEREKENERRAERGQAPIVDGPTFLPVEVYAPSALDIYDYLSLTFQEPIASIDTTALHLKMQVDTLWQDVPFSIEHDTIDVKMYNILADWQPGGSYTFEMDSLAVTGLYGQFTNKEKKDFKVQTIESYGQVFFNISGVDSTAFVELLDSKDEVVRTISVTNGHADFYYLTPGKYGARLIIDRNGNGLWDTGNYDEGRQPEEVYYYPQTIEFKANFDITQDWDIHSRELDKQKPDEMKKQKPDQKKERSNRNNNGRRN